MAPGWPGKHLADRHKQPANLGLGAVDLAGLRNFMDPSSRLVRLTA